MYQLRWKAYLKYFLLMGSIYLLLIILFKGQRINEFDGTKVSTTQIIFHNFMLFLKWQILFILSPIYCFFEMLVLSWTIKTGIITFGFKEAVDKIWRHGIIEFPTMFLYQLLSFRLFYYWWKEKSLTTIIEYVKENKKIYLLSVLLIIGAGIIEGIAW